MADNTVDLDVVLVLATLTDLDPHFLIPIISSSALATRRRLTIALFSQQFSGKSSHTERWDDMQRLLAFVYVQATKVAQGMGKMLLEVDVLLKDFDEDVQEDLGVGVDACFRVEGDTIAVILPPSITSLRQVYLAPDPPSPPQELHLPLTPQSPLPPFFPVVALGGTFDHLHAGHKILLSMGAWIASEKLIVGVTDDALLKSKSFSEVLEPLGVRINKVLAFLTLFNPAITYDVVPISDVYGPTAWDPNIQALVVSKETLPGAASIASHRELHSLPPLQTFIIDVISPTSSNLDPGDAELLKQTKMSSTLIREWIVRNGNK